MHLHQVLTGAVNPGDNCYSVGSVGDTPFTAYGSGCDIVILANDFECVQIIPGAKHGNIQVSCVECSQQQGRMYTSKLTSSILLGFLFVTFVFVAHSSYVCFCFFAQDDCLLKVWYPMTGWKSSLLPRESEEKKKSSALVHFSFVYLAHPRAVTGFSWRNTSKYMPRGSVCNVLLTSCHDGICRLWAETLLPEDSLLGEQICETSTSSSSSSLLHSGRQKDRIQHALEVLKGQRRSSVLITHTELLPDQQGSHEVQRHISHHANALCHFHIAASINPTIDIPSVLTGTAFNVDEGNGGFVVHWLNNKDFNFTSSIEVFMQHLRKLAEQQPEQDTDDADDSLCVSVSELSIDRESETGTGTGSSEHEDGEREGSPKTSPSASPRMPLPTVLLDRKIETLLTEWNRNPDMLFTIHPIDGTFLVWHVKYLDEYNPGIFRQVQVSFSSRIPVAFPSGDASSLSKNIMMYACTTSTKDVSSAVHQKTTNIPDSTLGINGPSSSQGSPNVNIMAPIVMMVSKHIDGSLNQWAVTFADKSAFTTVLTVSHKFRYCGHRFHLNDLACHSVLPLLLTSSHHNALLTPESDHPWDSDRLSKIMDPIKHLKGSSRQHLRNAATCTFHDPNAIYSELILWRVDPIGPLSYTGGVSELARINSLHTSAFSNVAWLPTLIPSYCLGTYCNSASACFVASDGKNLRLYQAVVDARKLLDELSDPECSKLIGEVFNIVSQQSTARPGCIIELDAITNQCGSNTQLLHVFQEDFILGYKPHKEDVEGKETETFFKPSQEKFYLVVIEKDRNGCSVLHMWHLHLKSVQASKKPEVTSSENQLCVPEQKTVESSPDTSPGSTPMPRSSSIANLQTASKLILSSRLVYSYPLDLPTGVEVIRATPSAGHLSSSSIYPVCLAPYLVVTSCSDNKVRFWRCTVEMDLNSGKEVRETYHWRKWPLMNDDGEDNSSTVRIIGRPVAVSCSYTGRLAVAYKQPVQHNGFVSKEFCMHVCIFECESTGGSEWVLEQTVHLDDLVKVGSVLDSRVSVDSNLFVYSKSDVFLNKDKYLMPNIKHLVHLDWVSKEDGSHILTVGVGANIFMYGRLSGIVTEQTNSKDGVAIITLPLGGSIKQGIKSKWVLLRSIDLVSSVDGTPSLPVSLSWVRDGILVVGMDCEMHVYAQWKHAVKFGDGESDIFSAEDSATQDPLKTSLLAKKTSVIDGAGVVDDVFGTPTVIQDGGLFEAAHVLSPTLPQYHPTQLLELMDLGKVRRAKAILSHLVKCIAGEVAIVRDAEAGEGGGPKRHLSRTISVSGSTAKDTITAGKDGTRDYTEIDSIPPLPLYALLAADQDTTYKISEETSKVPKGFEDHTKRKTEDQYSHLFQMQPVTTDDFIDFEIEKRESKSKVINLSQYGPSYFGREHASVLSSHLMHSSLPGLTRLEQMFLVALADTVATTSTELDENRDKTYSGRDTLDECGLRYLLAMRLHTCLLTSLPPLYRGQLLHQGVSTCHFAWAFHSEAEEELINMIPAIQRGDPQWSELRAMGIGWWVRNINTLRRCIEKVAKASFQRNNDALDAAIFYLAMKKKAVVWGLFRSQYDEKMTTFFSHNFSEDRWRKAALKNAFALLGKQRFEQSAAFFLLAGSLKDAIEVCLEKMEDIQLAMVIARLYESEFETSVTYTSILYEKILGCQKDGTGFRCTKLHPDPFLRSLAYWITKDYTRALDTLLEQTPKEDDENPVIIKSCNPVVFSFYNYLRTHPLLLRRYFSSPEGTLAALGIKTEKSFVDKINLIERKLFFTTANAHFKVGCPVLALEVLSKIPKISKKSKSNTVSDGAESSNIDWSKPFSASSALESSTGSSAQFDWSQPAVKFDEESLTLDWGEDKDGSEEEKDDVGLTMKGSKLDSKNGKLDEKSAHTNVLQTPQGEDSDAGDTEVDVIAEQLKFRACLKILMTELRTLATGYEVDGGKLRFQLYNWLEKEIAAMHEICNHEAGGKDYCETYTKVDGDLLDHEEIVDKPDIGSYERHQIERRRLQAKREHAERRKWWLQKNQALLRVFLSYCSLHGAQGGGLASVRMELKFLLQESQQETTVKQLQSPLPLPTTLPLLSASIASTKTVIANPVLYLNNHIHDILYTIVQMKFPPHPNIEDVKVHTLHSLAASLSASIYQALCDSHSYSQTETNQFTGMVYQGLLLSDRRRLRTESIEEHATPNSTPAQWPGVSSLINLLNSAQDEDQPKLNILLCEAVVAVYLSLLIHALATNSCNELFRLAAHPLNSRMWAAVFGGGVKLVVKPRRQSENIPGRPVKDSVVPPPVPAERPSYKEKFIPPELSMWDYFMAKPFLPLSDSGVIYDSDESIHSDEEDDDGAFLSDTQIQEHKDANSYRLVGTLFIQNLPVTSPLGIAVIKNLENWEQILQERVDQFEGPPPNYINTYPSDLGVGAGSAILRNKAMLEPENTPFKSRDYSALPVKRLWHFLVKQELLQETFIRYIFTKKRKQSEVEADLGYPGGKAKIIHKESDMIMAFAVNKANSNEIVLASTHDVQELDVSALLAAQSFIWIGEEYDRESKSSDDLDFRGSTTTLTQSSAPSFGVNQMQPSSPMPWLGSGQTSTGAGVVCSLFYLTGAQDGSVRMFEWTRPQQLICFRQAGNARVTRMYFNSQGNKCGVADGEGFLSIWQVNQIVSNPKPYLSWQCHSKTTSDFAFITASSLVATSGQSNENRNVCLWDTLVSPGNSLIHAFTCHDHGATVLQYAPKQQLLISGGRKGCVCIFDIRQRQILHTFQAHDSAIKALSLDPSEEYFATGSAEGNMKVWGLTGYGLIHSFKNEHAKQSIFRNIGAGVMQIETVQDNRIFSCGADGTLKMRVLPNAFNIPAGIFDVL
uniref:Dmx like 2 n=1 Tax=Chelydra serpentina TaxID=8475 RepID=A0A8C3SKA2_CHESE